MAFLVPNRRWEVLQQYGWFHAVDKRQGRARRALSRTLLVQISPSNSTAETNATQERKWGALQRDPLHFVQRDLVTGSVNKLSCSGRFVRSDGLRIFNLAAIRVP